VSKFSIIKEAYEPTKREVFWCSPCDSNQVDSEIEGTGKFFIQFGHSFSQRTKSYDGDYTGVMFAVCSSCLNKQAKG
jgi:hypothetical protein